ncbi:MAG: multiple sugar transport system permease protein [Microbacteriaceae bacterium]|nr:multiple sugar transport system permease protein [Microbacteriaceae bacterium]
MTSIISPRTLSTEVATGKPQTKAKNRRRWIYTLAVGLAALLVNVPLLNALLVSFKSNGDITGNPLALPAHPTVSHYTNVFYGAGYDFPRYFLNSGLIALGTVLLVLILAVPGTYASVRLGFGSSRIVHLASGLRLLPAIFFVVPLFILFSNMGLQDTIPGLIVADTFVNLPLAIILIAAGMQDLPVEVEEAAAMDGASIYRTLFSVVVPMLGSALVSVAVLTFIFSWEDYLFALVLSTSNATPVTLGAANFITSTGIKWGDISAASILSTLPPLVFAVFAQRYLVSGLSAGAVKG